MLLEARATSRTSEPLVALAPAPPASRDTARIRDSRCAPGLVATLGAQLTRRSKKSGRALVALLARKAREAVACRHEEGRRVADAAAVARRGTEAVGEQGEFAILSAHHQVVFFFCSDYENRRLQSYTHNYFLRGPPDRYSATS